MRYYVISSDGQRYGPADLDTLNRWIQEGRLLPHQMLEDESTGQRVPASSVQGLSFQQSAAAYPRGTPQDGADEVRRAWLFSALGWVFGCCGCVAIVFAILGLTNANQAIQKGNRAGETAKIFSIIVLVLVVLGNFGWIGCGGLPDRANFMPRF